MSDKTDLKKRLQADKKRYVRGSDITAQGLRWEAADHIAALEKVVKAARVQGRIYGAWTGLRDALVALPLTSEKRTPCTNETPCCDRRSEYNGYGSDGSLKFICPKSCPCHD